MSELRLASCHDQAAVLLTRECSDGPLDLAGITRAVTAPSLTEDLRGQMRRLLEQYEGRKSNPALRPAGALPVEWTVFAAPVPELAEFAEAQAREAQAREADEHQDGPYSGPDA